MRTSRSGSAAARCPSEPRIESAVACELLLPLLISQSSYRALSAEFFPFAGSFESIFDTAGMSQAEKTAKNRAKLSELCEGADVPVDYLCFLTHNMRARLVRYINSDEQSRACSLIRKWYENEDAHTERRHKVLRLMQRDRQERQRQPRSADTAASSSHTQVSYISIDSSGAWRRSVLNWSNYTARSVHTVATQPSRY